MWELRVQSLGWEDPLEKEMATHSSILTWEIPWTSGGLHPMEAQTVEHNWSTLAWSIYKRQTKFWLWLAYSKFMLYWMFKTKQTKCSAFHVWKTHVYESKKGSMNKIFHFWRIYLIILNYALKHFLGQLGSSMLIYLNITVVLYLCGNNMVTWDALIKNRCQAPSSD